MLVMFYHLCFFSWYSKVIYDDGDEETLDLTSEHWELVVEDNASDPVGSYQSFLFPSLLYSSVLYLSLIA